MWTGNKDFHQPQCIHPSALPDPRTPAAGASRCEATCGKRDTGFLPQRQREFLQKVTLNTKLPWCFVYREQNVWVKFSFGGLSWRWFSGEDCVIGGVTVYMETGEVRDIRHCRDSSQGPEENETWEMSLGYSDILHFEPIWKGSNTNWEVKAAAMNMTHLHENICYTTFTPSSSEVLWKLTQEACGNLELWILPDIFSFMFNWWNKIILSGDKGLSEIGKNGVVYSHECNVFGLVLTKSEMRDVGKIPHFIMWLINPHYVYSTFSLFRERLSNTLNSLCCI